MVDNNPEFNSKHPRVHDGRFTDKQKNEPIKTSGRQTQAEHIGFAEFMERNGFDEKMLRHINLEPFNRLSDVGKGRCSQCHAPLTTGGDNDPRNIPRKQPGPPLFNTRGEECRLCADCSKALVSPTVDHTVKEQENLYRGIVDGSTDRWDMLLKQFDQYGRIQVHPDGSIDCYGPDEKEPYGTITRDKDGVMTVTTRQDCEPGQRRKLGECTDYLEALQSAYGYAYWGRNDILRDNISERIRILANDPDHPQPRPLPDKRLKGKFCGLPSGASVTLKNGTILSIGNPDPCHNRFLVDVKIGGKGQGFADIFIDDHGREYLIYAGKRVYASRFTTRPESTSMPQPKTKQKQKNSKQTTPQRKQQNPSRQRTTTKRHRHHNNHRQHRRRTRNNNHYYDNNRPYPTYNTYPQYSPTRQRIRRTLHIVGTLLKKLFTNLIWDPKH